MAPKLLYSIVVWFSEIGQVSGEAKYLVSDSTDEDVQTTLRIWSLLLATDQQDEP